MDRGCYSAFYSCVQFSASCRVSRSHACIVSEVTPDSIVDLMRASLNAELFKENEFRTVSLTALVHYIHAVVHLPPLLPFTLAINHPAQALTFLSPGPAFPVPSIPIFENLHNGQKPWTNFFFSLRSGARGWDSNAGTHRIGEASDLLSGLDRL